MELSLIILQFSLMFAQNIMNTLLIHSYTRQSTLQFWENVANFGDCNLLPPPPAHICRSEELPSAEQVNAAMTI
jgi:hypothetical protein